jgi:hypothetical protein
MRRLIISLINRVKAVKLYFTMLRFSSSWLSSTATIFFRNSNFLSISLAKTWLAIKLAVAATFSDIKIIHAVPLILGGGFITPILFNNIIFMKLFFVLGSISSFIIILYYILNIFLFIKFSNNKNPVSAEVQDRLNYLPQFIKDWVKLIEKMSKYEEKGYFIEFYLRLIVLYLLIFLMCVILLIKLISV